MIRFVLYNVNRIMRIGDINLENINLIIAENLKKLREEKKLSLDATSKLTGVSKSMLGQIERGEVNPTISTIWKIANGFKISFTNLMQVQEEDIKLIHKKELEAFTEDEGKFRKYCLLPFDDERRFELYFVELDSNAYLKAEPHITGTEEFITVFSGELEVVLNDEVFNLKSEDFIRFKGDRPHSYRNIGDSICTFNSVIYYSK